eukprot:9484607-Pyramimonas_sp.AAC.2
MLLDDARDASALGRPDIALLEEVWRLVQVSAPANADGAPTPTSIREDALRRADVHVFDLVGILQQSPQ